MQWHPLNTLSAAEIASQVAAGRITCEAVARACLARVEARDGVVKAWAHLDPELVLHEAMRLDATPTRGALRGVPVGVKDIIETIDMPTEMGSPIYRGYRPFADASCVALLRAAGALIFGKTVTSEFAGATAAETTNPHDPSHTPGGSSSGSAAAVADFMVPVSFGTQTGGSVQRPASFCGVVGYKPTFGLINTAGVKPAAVSLDTVGLMARTVEDIELVTRVLTGRAEFAWLPADASVRFGLCRTPVWERAEEETKNAVEEAARRLAGLSFAVREVTLPACFGELVETREIINDYERARGMSYEWQAHRPRLSEGLANTIRKGFGISCERYIDAIERVARCRRVLDGVFNDVDVLIAPAVAGEAPRGLAYTGDHRFQSMWTQLQTPTVGLPTHTGPNGLPVSIQLVGAPHRDDRLLAFAQLAFRLLGRGPTIDAVCQQRTRRSRGVVTDWAAARCGR